MDVYLSKDSESDESENASLLARSDFTSPDIHKANEDHQSFDVEQTINTRMPSGKKFILKSDEIYAFKPRCTIFLGLLLLLGASWMMVKDAYIAMVVSCIALLITFIFIIYCITNICIYYKKDHWSTFIMILNMEQRAFYVVDQSSRRNWEISCIGNVNDLNLSIKKVTDKKAYVMIDETRFNTQYVRVDEAQKFIGLIKDYLTGIWQNEYINEQYMNGDMLETVEEDAQYDTDMLENGLNKLINGLVNSNDMGRHVDGKKLDEWYQRENCVLLKEYKQLIKQRDKERQRFEKYMNFEPRFTDDYIARMLLVKCNVMEILSD